MKTAVIGGTGLAALPGMPRPATDSAQTPYGTASGTPVAFDDMPDMVFLNRHGDGHTLLPHEINYRANLWLLRELTVDAVLAVLTVGGIATNLKDGDFVLPRQIVDYTWGREHTFSTGTRLFHADFSEPFDPALRNEVLAAMERTGERCHDGGVYGATQGPRFESAAEIDRMDRDGCTVVGMTAMPEAALARELELPYAGICMVVNPAAGRGAPVIELADMRAVVRNMRPRLLRVLREFRSGTR